jgi:predicted O-methyltransferase YrrM
MNPILQDMYANGTAMDSEGKSVPIHSHITEEEARFLEDFIRKDSNIVRTLEIGCGFGASALCICSAIAGRVGASHTMLDPFQTEGYRDVGMENLRRAGFDFARLIAERSEFGLPPLAQAEAGSYDLIFIDGNHTFDQVLVDIFFANKLVRIGGYIVLDDNDFPGVRRAISYLSKYPAYRVIGTCFPKLTTRAAWAKATFGHIPQFLWPLRTKSKLKIENLICPTMVALQKTKKDARHWAWYKPF